MALEPREYGFWTNLAKQIFGDNHHACLVLMETDCKHKWSVLDLRLHSY